METTAILELLRPYHDALHDDQARQISTYIELLLRWNAKMNLTSVRDPKHIVTRHFGEALFLARHLAARGFLREGTVVFDIGSGAGFPGIPLKIAFPEISLNLVEAHGRKAVFLKEVLRAVNLDAVVKNVRAEQLVLTDSGSADLVTLRAVEKFESILPVAAQFAKPTGILGILIGKEQVTIAKNLLKDWRFDPLWPIPGTESRGIAVVNHAS